MTEPGETKLCFHPERENLAKFLGQLEAEIMELLWENGPMTVKRTTHYLGNSKKIAYTTVMTVMNRLFEKNVLSRVKEGRSFVYEPTMEENIFLIYAVRTVMTSLIDDYPEVVNRIMSRLRKKKTKAKK